MSVVNSDLPNTLGNLLQRISSKRLLTGCHDSGCGLSYRQDLFPLSSQRDSSTAATADDHALIWQLQELSGETRLAATLGGGV